MQRASRPLLWIVPLLLLGLQTGGAHADDDADRHAAATAVLDQLHSADMVANIVPNIVAQIRRNATHDDATLGRQFDAMAPRLQSEAEATKPQLLAKLVDVYARTFTLAELQDMLAYYKSPVGQRIIETQATINHDMLTVARDWGTSIAKTMAQEVSVELQGTKTP